MIMSISNQSRQPHLPISKMPKSDLDNKYMGQMVPQ